MKILRIKLRNLNSLRGDHVVDFTQEPLASCSIFAITGPTGAGKSTLLDAMTLALYGKAARYQKESSPENMMSRHTTDCLAEVTFSIKELPYRAEWQLRRSRGKIDGKIQPATRFLYDAQNTPLNRTATEFDAEIEKLTGLDYERFLRSVLLAQGEFSRFLKANAEERAALLESLTGTSIYTELGKLAHDETGRREKSLDAINAALKHYQLLSEEEITLKQQSIKQDRDILAQQQILLQEQQQQWNKAEQRRQLEKSLESLTAQQQSLEQESQQRRDWREKIRIHQLASPFTASLLRYDLAHNKLTESRHNLTQADKAQTTAQLQHAIQLQQAIHFCEQHIQTNSDNQQKIQRKIEENDTQAKAIEEWLEVHAHWKNLPDAISQLSEQAHQLHTLHTLQRQTHAQQQQVHADLEKWEENQQQAQEAVQTHRTLYEQKNAALTEISQAAQNLLAAHSHQQIEELRDHWQQQERQLQQWLLIATQIEQLQKKQSTAEALAQQARETQAASMGTAERSTAALAEAEKQWRLRQDHWSSAHRLASYEDQRALLNDHEPCPLCGSLEHPFTKNQHTPPALQEIRQEMERAEILFTQAKESHTQCQTAMLHAEAQAKAAQQQVLELKRETESLQSRWQQEITAAGWGNIDSSALPQMINQITQQQQNLTEVARHLQQAQKEYDTAHAQWQQAQQRIIALKEQGEALKLAQQRLETTARERKQTITPLHDILAQNAAAFQLTIPDLTAENFSLSSWEKAASQYPRGEQILNELRHERKSHQVECQRLSEELTAQKEIQSSWREEAKNFPTPTEKAIQPLWDSLREAQIACQESQRIIEQNRTTRSLLEQQTAQAQRAWEEGEQSFLAELKGTCFEDIPSLRAALLPAAEEQQINAWHQDWQKRQQECHIALSQRNSEHQALIDSGAPDQETGLRLQQEMEQRKQQLTTLQQQITLGHDALERDAQQRAEFHRKSAEVAQQLRDLETWQILRTLIGSHDGAKFRKFAQGISLDILIHHANVHLRNLSDRYRLQRQTQAELTLEITDLYQANSCRPMASLSGGESFIVSLALALGLSDLAGRNVQIDSLFIDEGFGTLDADALDTALSTLESLHQQNKTIGIISHIDLLKERIRTKINIRKLSAGSSIVEVA